MQQVAAMPTQTLIVLYRMFFLGGSACIFVLAALISDLTPALLPGGTPLSGSISVPVLCALSCLLAALCLAFSFPDPTGRRLSSLTFAASCLLLGASLSFLPTAIGTASSDLLAFSAAIMMILRVLAVWVLPPRGERCGTREAFVSSQLSILCCGLWLAVDPIQAPVAGAVCLLLSWPYLADGINAFADKVYHEAAKAAGLRNVAPGTFTKVATARDIVIDKAAVMSGPTLTVTNVMAFDNDPRTLLAVAASAEAGSDHPVAHALRQLAEQWQVDLKHPDRIDPAPGLGVVALLGGQTVVVGTTDLLNKLKIDSFTADAIAKSLEADGKTVLRVAVGGRVVGVLGLEGTLRQDAGVAGMALRAEGLVPWLYSGDSEKTRQALAEMLGLEPVADPKPGESASEAAFRTLEDHNPLVLTLSQDRTSFELRSFRPSASDETTPETTLLAVSSTDDIGAFPALKELAMRRTALAVHARRFLSGLSVMCGICGGLLLLPLSATPVLFAVNLAILWGFARFSVADRSQQVVNNALIAAN
ncbi:HAD family hydrolase [Labrenzia sp. PHM005]|nr:HAD family hydrolase [Labrenzia sp. PHM005]